MSAASVDEYVCPRCGAPAAGNSVCAVCAEDLDAIETLPVRSEYGGLGAPPRRRRRRPSLTPMVLRPARALRDRPAIAGVTVSLVPLLSLSMTWFELEGPFFLIFADADPWLTGWEAFAWQDVVLAVIASALAAAAVARRIPQTLSVAIAVLGAALAVAMIAGPPPVSAEQQNYGGGEYVSTRWGWLAVAAFVLVAVISGLRARACARDPRGTALS